MRRAAHSERARTLAFYATALAMVGVLLSMELSKHAEAEAHVPSVEDLQEGVRTLVVAGQQVSYLPGAELSVNGELCTRNPVVRDGYEFSLLPPPKRQVDVTAPPGPQVFATNITHVLRDSLRTTVVIFDAQEGYYVGADPTTGQTVPIGMAYDVSADGSC